MADQLVPTRDTLLPRISSVIVQTARTGDWGAGPDYASRLGAAPVQTEFAEVRARLVWLSAGMAAMRMLCETRSLTPAESTRLAQLQGESDGLQARLTELRDAARQN
jgi:hypothetical protein